MNEQDRWKLQHNHQILMSDIPDEVIDKLYSKGTIYLEDLNRITVQSITEDKNKVLLRILPTRGPSAYSQFREILSHCRNCQYLVERLDTTPPKVCKNAVDAQMDTDCNFALKTPKQVRQWLVKECGFNEEQARVFETEEIDGEALCELLTDENYISAIKTFTPNLPAGKIVKLRKAFNALNVVVHLPPGGAQDARELPECADRQTGDSSRSNSNYVLNTVHFAFNHSGGNLLADFHYYIAIKNRFTEGAVLKEVVSTIAACLNSFQNAVIHMGIETDGTIKGVRLDDHDDDDVQHFRMQILKSFPEDQRQMIDKQISQLHFIEVHDQTQNVTKFKVVEINISPLLHNQEVFVSSVNDGNSSFFVLKDEKVIGLETDAQKQFLKERPVWRKAREEALKGGDNRPPSFYSEKVQKLVEKMTLGNGFINDGMFPILVANSLPKSMSKEAIQTWYSFVDTVQWASVFDFDSSAIICRYLQDKGDPISVKKIEDMSEDDVKLLSPNFTPWLSMNGYGEAGIDDPLKYRLHHREQLRKIIDILKKEVPLSRAMIVFALFSGNYQIMLELFSEIVTSFPNQWCVVCDDEKLLKAWDQEIINRKYEDGSVLKENSVVGIPWHLFSEQVKLINEPKLSVPCRIPSSSGEVVTLTEKKDLTCLEIVGVDECEQQLKQLSKRKDISCLKKEEERRFFRGGKVSWQNFELGHVCKRDIHATFLKNVKDVLERKPSKLDEEDSVGIINFYHQPGAGGTTSSRNVLWDLRHEYRCGIVKEITPVKTSDHVYRLRMFGEDCERRARPVLLLLENEDPDSIRLLRTELEHGAKRNQREAAFDDTTCDQDQGSFEENITCFSVVLLICRRQKKNSGNKDLILRHRLSTQELQWFETKYNELEMEYKNKRGSDPALLFSFNIMKTNFDSEAIKNTVRNILTNMTDETERLVLKYVSLLNCYDQEFRPVPVSVFDVFVANKRPVPKKMSYGLVLPVAQRAEIHNPQWEQTASESWKLLVIEKCDNNYRGFTTCSKLLAKEILSNFTQKQTLGTITKEFLSCKDIFSTRGVSYYGKTLHDITQDILRRRVQEVGQKSKYSPLVNEVLKAESDKVAADLLIKGYEIFDNPFIAQQIARLFMYSGTCELNDDSHQKALEYAEKGLAQRPKSSYLHDTVGQVHKKQLLKALDVLRSTGTPIASNAEVIQCAFDAIAAFRQAQLYKQPEKPQGVFIMAGYHGELDTFNKLVEYLQMLPGLGEDDVKKLFLDPNFFPDWVESTSPEIVHELKSLKQTVHETPVAVEGLENEVREQRLDVMQVAMKNSMKKRLAKVTEQLLRYFGKQNYKIMDVLGEFGKCEYRRIKAAGLCGYSFSGMVKMAKTVRKHEANTSLLHVYRLMQQNCNSNSRTAKDVLVMMGAYITLSCVLRYATSEPGFTHEGMVEWSHLLFDQRVTLSETEVYLEPYLFYVMLNWSSIESKGNQALHVSLNKVMEYWKKDYDKKYPAKYLKERNTFFIAKGSGLSCFVHPSKFTNSYYGPKFWKSDEVKRELNQFHGKVTGNLDGVEFLLHTSPKQIIRIPSAIPISFDSWRNREVLFYIGLTWSGPVAYGIQKITTEQAEFPREESQETLENVPHLENSVWPSV